MKTMGQKIQRICREQNLTQTDLSMISGISYSTISFILRDKIIPHQKTIKTIAAALGVKVIDLYPDGTLEAVSGDDAANVIKRIWLELGIPYSELVNKAGLHMSTLNNILCGKALPRNSTKELIAEVVNIPVDTLFSGEPLSQE